MCHLNGFEQTYPQTGRHAVRTTQGHKTLTTTMMAGHVYTLIAHTLSMKFSLAQSSSVAVLWERSITEAEGDNMT